MLSTRFNHGGVRKVLLSAGMTLALVSLLLIAASQTLSSKEVTVTGIGMGSYQFAGRIDQDGLAFVGYGYLYDVQGIAPQALFSDPLNPSESTAYLTYYATATLSSRAVVTDSTRGIFALDSVGEITYYHQATPTASFDNPASFAYGTPVTTATVRFQDVLSVQGANRGLAAGNGEFAMLTAEEFTLGGQTVRLGLPGRAYQVSTWGDAVRTEAVIPQSSVLLAGSAVASPTRQTYLPFVTRTQATE
jgi:hypothetical protein